MKEALKIITKRINVLRKFEYFNMLLALIIIYPFIYYYGYYLRDINPFYANFLYSIASSILVSILIYFMTTIKEKELKEYNKLLKHIESLSYEMKIFLNKINFIKFDNKELIKELYILIKIEKDVRNIFVGNLNGELKKVLSIYDLNIDDIYITKYENLEEYIGSFKNEDDLLNSINEFISKKILSIEAMLVDLRDVYPVI